MRSIFAFTSLTVLLLAVGCNIAPHRRDLPPSGGAAPTGNAMPKAEDLVKYLNDNADLIEPGQAIDCGNVTIDVNADGQRVGLGGMMRCQAPRNFLLRGEVFGKPEVELGSNTQEFWYWIARNQPPALFHCSYDALARGTRIPFPFQPEMVLNTLGLAHYDAAGKYDVKTVDLGRGRKGIELIEAGMSPQNTPIQKVTVFDYDTRTVPNPQVIAYILRDGQGKSICVANVIRAQHVGARNAIIPKEIRFNWPEAKLQMRMTLENPKLIAMPPEKAGQVFTRQNLNVQSIDLATQSIDGPGLQRASGTIARP